MIWDKSYKFSEDYISRLRFANGQVLRRIQHKVIVVVGEQNIFGEKVLRFNRVEKGHRVISWISRQVRVLLEGFIVVAGRQDPFGDFLLGKMGGPSSLHFSFATLDLLVRLSGVPPLERQFADTECG